MTGLELRGCWQERPQPAHAPAPDPALHETPRLRPTPDASEDSWAVVARDFVPVELLGRRVVRTRATDPGEDAPVPEAVPLLPEIDETWTERTSLFGDAEG